MSVLKGFFMKRMLLWIVLFIGGLDINSIEANCLDEGWDAQVRIAAFNPTAHKFRKIYSSWGPDYQIEIGKDLYRDWGLFANAAWYHREGRSIGLRDKTDVTFVPISFGVKYFFCLTTLVRAYVGGGAVYTFLRTTDHSPFVKKHSRDGTWGGIVKTGLQYTISECFFIDLFADYIIQHFQFHHREGVERPSLNGGALKLGIGLGMRI